MTPPELFLASLGSCAAYYAAEYLRQKGLATEGTRVQVIAEKVPNPPRVDNIRIEVELPLACDERDRAEGGSGTKLKAKRPPARESQSRFSADSSACYA